MDDRTLVLVRERSFLEVLDLALVVIRKRPVTIGLAALAGIVPCAALNAWLMSVPDFPFGGYVFLVLFEVPWATAPLTVVLGVIMFGGKPRIGRVLVALLRAIPSMVLFQGMARGLLIVSFFGYPLVPARLSFLNEVILLERGRWWSAVRRSGNLTGRRGGELFAQWLAQLFFGFLFIFCFWMGTNAALNGLTSQELTWEAPNWADALGPLSQLGLWIAIAFFGVARFLTYIDQRIRMEGWEVKLHLSAVGAAMEESSRW